MQIVMFTKMLGHLSIDDVADVIADLGFDGVDLTVRPHGHVLPENVETDLPRAQEILTRRHFPISMISTGVVDASDPYAEAIFKTAARCGISFLKLGYWPYAGFGHLRSQIGEARRKLVGIEALAQKYGLKACVHIHSGDTLSALAPVVALLLEGCDRHALGAYIDPGHMSVEGGLSGWVQGLDLLADFVTLVGVKSFGWFPETDPVTAEHRWVPKIVPLAEGNVCWSKVFALLKQIGFDGVVSVHSEYGGTESWRALSPAEIVKQTRADLAYLRSVLGGTGPSPGP
jgi:sugar phosphate isomerase/epimerase